MTVAKGMRAELVSSDLHAAFLLEPPGWTRLEPQSVSGDPTPGLEARLHDPLWLLARQWQLGELSGDDAGSPIIASISSVDVPLNRYAGATGGATYYHLVSAATTNATVIKASAGTIYQITVNGARTSAFNFRR